jgi:hypothetical protein
MENQWENKVFTDLRLHVRARKINNSCVEYEVREIDTWDGPYTYPSNKAMESTSNLEEADILLKGSIRFDGCSHNYFGEGGYIHGCFREHMTRLGTLYDHLFDWAIELIGHKEFLEKSWK